jgi:hypothetical protein
VNLPACGPATGGRFAARRDNGTAMVYLRLAMNAAKVWRRTLFVALAVLCQGVLAVHDAQHIDEQPSTCSVCQAHLPLIAADPGSIVSLVPTVEIIATAPHCLRAAGNHRPYSTFLSRAPPGSLT